VHISGGLYFLAENISVFV